MTAGNGGGLPLSLAALDGPKLNRHPAGFAHKLGAAESEILRVYVANEAGRLVTN